MKKYKIVIYGCGKDAKTLEEFIDEYGCVDILYFVQTKKDRDEYHGFKVNNYDDIVWSELDYVVVATRKYYDDIKKVLCENNADERKIIELYSFMELVKKFKPNYSTCIAENRLNYVYSSEDKFIGPFMKYSGRNHGDTMMKELLTLARRFFAFDDTGYFLDIGANIGTASIYAKYLMPDIKVVGFEPSRQNYNVYRCNCILNDMEDIKTVNVGLGDVPSQLGYSYMIDNPGGGYITDNAEKCTEMIHITTLDSYLEEQHINPNDISFIWMDVEGFESEVIIGGRKTLSQKKIPMVQEFNPSYYVSKGKADEYCKIMEECYDFFVDVRNINLDALDIMPISRLKEFVYSNETQTDLFFF